ncbi:serine endopeptidase, partial [Myxococcus xanthus]|nr:serine endopeptidase [Myxococcus xanthus]
KARSESQTARESFDNWIATRSATQQSEHNPEVVQRTQALDALKARERETQQAVEAPQQAALDARQAAGAARQRLEQLEAGGYERMRVAQRKVELRVFLYRLALTLPLLVAAGWLFAKKRQSTWWPFVWGFIFFAVFVFFVELVP